MIDKQYKKEELPDAQEIADDVQQTYGEMISNEYRALVQKRISALLNKQKADMFDGIKRIMSHNFTTERDKRRLTDKEKNAELVSFLGSALTVIETQTKEDLGRYLVNNEDILTIVPKRQFEDGQD